MALHRVVLLQVHFGRLCGGLVRSHFDGGLAMFAAMVGAAEGLIADAAAALVPRGQGFWLPGARGCYLLRVSANRFGILVLRVLWKPAALMIVVRPHSHDYSQLCLMVAPVAMISLFNRKIRWRRAQRRRLRARMPSACRRLCHSWILLAVSMLVVTIGPGCTQHDVSMGSFADWCLQEVNKSVELANTSLAGERGLEPLGWQKPPTDHDVLSGSLKAAAAALLEPHFVAHDGSEFCFEDPRVGLHQSAAIGPSGVAVWAAGSLGRSPEPPRWEGPLDAHRAVLDRMPGSAATVERSPEPHCWEGPLFVLRGHWLGYHSRGESAVMLLRAIHLAGQRSPEPRGWEGPLFGYCLLAYRYDYAINVLLASCERRPEPPRWEGPLLRICIWPDQLPLEASRTGSAHWHDPVMVIEAPALWDVSAPPVVLPRVFEGDAGRLLVVPRIVGGRHHFPFALPDAPPAVCLAGTSVGTVVESWRVLTEGVSAGVRSAACVGGAPFLPTLEASCWRSTL